MISEQKFLKMRDSIELSMRIEERGCPVWLIGTHGIGEHLGRHRYLSQIVGNDINLFQYDLRGHGKSTGKRGYINNFSDYMEDLREIVNFLREKYKMKKYVLFGHSMGALITAAYTQNYINPDFAPLGVILNAPPAGIPGALGLVVEKAPLSWLQKLSSLKKGIYLSGLVDLKYLSHDPRTIEKYQQDELVLQKLHTSLLTGLAMTSKDVFSRPINPPCQAFCSVGDGDGVVSVQALKHYFEKIENGFTFKVFEGAYHEAHNEVEKYREPYFEYLKKTLQSICFTL